MSQNRKICLYKNCDRQTGLTLFRFPTNKERFLVWAEYAGLELNGDVDILEPRYLCEKHFSLNYISNQSRRKMLVHTAVPHKWNESEVNTTHMPIKYKIIEPLVRKQRKIIHPPREISNKSIETSPKILNNSNNNKRKILQEAYEAAAEEEYIEEYVDEQHKQNDLILESNDNLILEDTNSPSRKKAPQRTYNCIVVKPSQKPKTIMNYIKPINNDEMKEEETFFVTEEGSDTKVERKSQSASVGSSSQVSTTNVQLKPIESYSEFIFNNEIYVQMPKRIFEEEKEKLRAESLKYKNMLLKLKQQIDSCIE
ncbi:hypothetical protein PVAND_010906 [Polypedilum vanderplanki]|uniref:THAP-type domain-containing protein n=1 Tax=Polypedilum vanderplanki TaxID=319348 RepID=A0A9J6CGY9_POLVA|nr:hypothetical protein PVAND_010906 [Polypedilum vanderplanki]